MPLQHLVALRVDPFSLALHFQLPLSEKKISLYTVFHICLYLLQRRLRNTTMITNSLWNAYWKNMNSYFMYSKLTPRDIPVFCCVIWLHHIATAFHYLPCWKAKWNKEKNKLWSKVYTGTTHSLILGSLRLHLFCAKITSLL